MEKQSSPGARVRPGDQLSAGRYRLDECVSALQKSLRRGDEEGALFWASEVDLSRYGGWAWKRLRKMALWASPSAASWLMSGLVRELAR